MNATTLQESNYVQMEIKPKRIMNPKFRKPKQKDRRGPKFLTEGQVEELIQVAYKASLPSHRKRNALMLMMLFRHGLRRTEAIQLRWDQINMKDAQLHVYRLKNGKMSIHPIKERELRMINEHRKTAPSNIYVFTDSAGVPLGREGIRRMIYMVGSKSSIPYTIHPHMFRHGCGYYLANNGVDTRAIQDYLGHKDIKKTVVYTEMAPNRFNNFWKD